MTICPPSLGLATLHGDIPRLPPAARRQTPRPPFRQLAHAPWQCSAPVPKFDGCVLGTKWQMNRNGEGPAASARESRSTR